MLTGTYRFPPMESVIYGRPFAEALSEQVERSGANAVFLLASGTLNRETDMVEQVRRRSATGWPASSPGSARTRRGSMSSRRRMRRARPAPTCWSRSAAAR